MNRSKWFSEEVLPHEPALRGYLRNNFPTVETDDVVQDSYLKLIRSGALGKIASTKAYLFSVARNTALTLFHRRRIYSETPLDELPSWRVLDGGLDGAQALAGRERFELMAAAIEQLPDRCREVMSLAVLRGQDNAEIAQALGLSENTVRVHLARGIKKCADFLRERGARP